MKPQLSLSSQGAPSTEQALIEIIRTLDPYRISQVLEFARWLQIQLPLAKWGDEELTEADLKAEEEAWLQVYLESKDKFRAMARENKDRFCTMARQALSDLDAGETLEMTRENDKISVH